VLCFLNKEIHTDFIKYSRDAAMGSCTEPDEASSHQQDIHLGAAVRTRTYWHVGILPNGSISKEEWAQNIVYGYNCIYFMGIHTDRPWPAGQCKIRPIEVHKLTYLMNMALSWAKWNDRDIVGCVSILSALYSTADMITSPRTKKILICILNLTSGLSV
jgi:hypothetical protein